jgi:ankyrin repeat protein
MYYANVGKKRHVRCCCFSSCIEDFHCCKQLDIHVVYANRSPSLLPDLNMQFGKTPLHFAARDEAVGVVQSLLDKGASVDAKDWVRLIRHLHA